MTDIYLALVTITAQKKKIPLIVCLRSQLLKLPIVVQGMELSRQTPRPVLCRRTSQWLQQTFLADGDGEGAVRTGRRCKWAKSSQWIPFTHLNYEGRMLLTVVTLKPGLSSSACLRNCVPVHRLSGDANQVVISYLATLLRRHRAILQHLVSLYFCGGGDMGHFN